MLAKVVAALEGIAAAIAKASEGSRGGPVEDPVARARILPLEQSEQQLRAAFARHAEAIAQLQRTRETVDPGRILLLEQEVAALRTALKKLNGKLAGDPELRAQREAPSAPPGFVILGGEGPPEVRP